MTVPTFVVGTGRCGSTMLTNMVRDHPKVLSLSEFFALVTDGVQTAGPAFPTQPLDGRQFWDVVAARTPWISFFLKHRVRTEEWLYPGEAPDHRFSSQTGVPAILLTALPHLTADYEHLFDVLHDEVSAWPPSTAGEHYRRLFGWLTRHFGKQCWIERSGGAIGLTTQLLATFPDAKFVHVVRDGRDVALSMQKHPLFRVGHLMIMLEQYLAVNPVLSLDRSSLDRVPEALRRFLPERFDVAALDDHAVEAPFSGQVWSQWLSQGIADLQALPTDRLLILRYEDFFTDPKCQLDRFAAFLGEEFVDDDWSTRCATKVRMPRSSWRDLPEAEARALTEACRPGFASLESLGVFYDSQ